MPFFQLKKTQRYNVSKKSDCIQTVQLLDETQIECTLTVESTGRECLENVLLRIGVSQLLYFGLRFEAKEAGGGQTWRWLDLNKPLKKQLQKRAGGAGGSSSVSSSSSSASPAAAQVVHLGIQHYALQPHCIADDVTRYQFFLQLRNDMAESRLTCSYEQMILMASYCLQAEFGDYDYARQNQDYAREIETFDQAILSRLYSASAQQQGFLPDIGPHIVDCHIGLAGVAADVAEQEYIKMAEQLDGYGVEYFKVKSEQGADAFFGCSPSGIVVRRPDGHILHYLRWSDIANLSHNKKQLNIEISSKKKQTTKLIAEDPGLAKYLWKMTSLHRQFHLREDVGSSGSSSASTSTSLPSSKRFDVKYHDGAIGPIPDIQQTTLQVDGRVIHESAIDVDFNRRSPDRPGASVTMAIDPRSMALMQAQRVNGDSDIAQVPRGYGYAPPVPATAPSQAAYPASISTPPTMAAHNQSTSIASAGAHGSGTPSLGRVAAGMALPTYRPTPDYETVMKQKLQVQPSPTPLLQQQQQRSAPSPVPQQQQHPPSPLPAGGGRQRTAASLASSAAAAAAVATTASSSHPAAAPVSKYVNGRFTKRSSLSASQPDVYAAVAPANSIPSGEPLYANISDYVAASRQRRAVNRSSSLIVHATYSQPDVSSAADADLPMLPHQSVSSAATATAPLVMRHPDDISQMLLRDYRPPPAYGDKFRSTPDLTSHIVAGAVSRVTIGGGAGLQLSPDVVSRRYRTAVAPVVASSAAATPPSVAAKKAATFIPNMSQKQYKSFDNLASIGDDDDDANRDDGRLGGGGSSGSRRASQTSNDTFHEVESDDDDDDGAHSSSSSNGGGTGDHGSFTVAAHPDGGAGNRSPVDAGMGGGRPPSRELASPLRADQRRFVVPSDQTMAAAGPPPMAVITTSPAATALAASAVTVGGASAPAVVNGGGLRGGSSSLPHDGSLLPASHEGVLQTTAVAEDRFPKDDRRRLLEEKLAEKAVFAEYDSVPKKRAKADCKVALQPECAPLNRFPNVLPYEDTRVRLSPREHNKLGYINASHVVVKVGTAGAFASTAGEECRYIATQNPQDNTREDFWQMVWEHNVHVVTMASGLEELGQMKCARYWPQEVGPKAAIAFDEVLVILKWSNVSPCFVTHCFKVKHTKTGQTRNVWHIQYTDWPESGCPENIHGFLAYLDEINSVRLHVQTQMNVHGPLVVHCSAGVARTGVVVLCDIMKKCLEYNQQVNVSDVLSQLRQQRMYMVQTSAQYVFCYKVLIEYLKGSRLI